MYIVFCIDSFPICLRKLYYCSSSPRKWISFPLLLLLLFLTFVWLGASPFVVSVYGTQTIERNITFYDVYKRIQGDLTYYRIVLRSTARTNNTKTKKDGLVCRNDIRFYFSIYIFICLLPSFLLSFAPIHNILRFLYYPFLCLNVVYECNTFCVFLFLINHLIFHVSLVYNKILF